MSKSILQSIKPQYCELIASGKKTIEVRKTRPKLDVPFKVYIYETKFINRCKDCEYCSFESIVMSRMKDVCKYEENNWKITSLSSRCFQNKYSGGKVIGEYVCDEIVPFGFTPYNHGEYMLSGNADSERDVLKDSCLSFSEMYEYIGEGCGYAWHISNLKIYDKPKELSEFEIIDKEFLKECPYRIRVYNNPDYTNGALLKGSYVCNNSFEPDFCRGQCGSATKPLTRPPQSWCYVEEG